MAAGSEILRRTAAYRMWPPEARFLDERRATAGSRRLAGGIRPSGSHVLIDEDRVAVRVHSHEAGRTGCALVRLLLQFHALCLELTL